MIKSRRAFLWESILNKLEKAYGSCITYLIDIRYLGKWIKEFPYCFPKFMIEGNYTAIFNPNRFRWEIYKGKHKVDFNHNHWL